MKPLHVLATTDTIGEICFVTNPLNVFHPDPMECVKGQFLSKKWMFAEAIIVATAVLQNIALERKEARPDVDDEILSSEWSLF